MNHDVKVCHPVSTETSQFARLLSQACLSGFSGVSKKFHMSATFSVILPNELDIGDYVRLPVGQYYGSKNVKAVIQGENGPIRLTTQVDRVANILKPLQRLHKNAGNYELTIAIPRGLPKLIKVDVELTDSKSIKTPQRMKRAFLVGKRQKRLRRLTLEFLG